MEFKRTKVSIVNKRRFYISIFIIVLFVMILLSFIFPLKKVSGDVQIDYRTYTVESGDTLWTIAENITPKRSDIRNTVYNLRKMNGLDQSTVLQLGDKLLIPGTID